MNCELCLMHKKRMSQNAYQKDKGDNKLWKLTQRIKKIEMNVKKMYDGLSKGLDAFYHGLLLAKVHEYDFENNCIELIADY